VNKHKRPLHSASVLARVTLVNERSESDSLASSSSYLLVSVASRYWCVSLGVSIVI